MHEPRNGARAFRCPHCHALASMAWKVHGTVNNLGLLREARCAACQGFSVWLLAPPPGRRGFKEGEQDSVEGRMIWPLDVGGAPPASSDMPDDVADLYREAATVYGLSPRSSAALLRLALQVLLGHLGLPGRNINQDIAALVEQGLPVRVQQAMDTLRIVGNNAVHPGQIDLGEGAQAAIALFNLLNLVVEDRISTPRRVQELYDTLPAGALAAVERRDAD